MNITNFILLFKPNRNESTTVNPLSTNLEKWSNRLKQIVANMPTICLSMFDHFINLALKGLSITISFA